MKQPLSLTQEQTQQLLLTPQMRQSLEILQLDTLALREKILDALETNPVLELAPEDPELSLSEESGEWSVREKEDAGAPAADEQAEDPFSRLSCPVTSLREILCSQLAGLRLTQEQQRLVHYIIDSLDENGWLPENSQEISQRLGAPIEAVRWGIQTIQSLEPAGVGGVDLRECLRIQAERQQLSPLVLEIIDNWLPALAANQLAEIRRALGVRQAAVGEAVAQIRSLNPRPGAAFAAGQTVYIVPDVRVFLEGGVFRLSVGNPLLPTLQINLDYQRLLEQEEDPQVTAYLRSCLKRARSLTQSIAQRNRTLSLCMMEIVQRQPEYFYDAHGYLHPMTMGEIGQALGLNVSTVSRAMKDKYVQCSHGVVALSSLFTSGTKRSLQQESVSAQQLQTEIDHLIQAEDKAHPLSDQAIAERLSHAGMPVARRTVAKYRMRLGLLPAPQRRQIQPGK